VAQYGVEDPSLAKGQRHQYRFVVAGAGVLRIGVCGGQHGHIFTGATQGAVEFIRSVHPDGRQALEDGVFRLTSGDLERAARAMRSGMTG
jgi:hypothetical protein